MYKRKHHKKETGNPFWLQESKYCGAGHNKAMLFYYWKTKAVNVSSCNQHQKKQNKTKKYLKITAFCFGLNLSLKTKQKQCCDRYKWHLRKNIHKTRVYPLHHAHLWTTLKTENTMVKAGHTLFPKQKRALNWKGGSDQLLLQVKQKTPQSDR